MTNVEDYMNLLEDEQRKQALLVHKIRSIFTNTVEGKEALEAILTLGGIDECSFTAVDSNGRIDPIASALRDGRRSLALDIKRICQNQ